MKKIYEVVQEEDSDCGICCLESIIKYYKGFIPLETLRIETKTDNNGTNAYELIECSKKYGFNSHGEKVLITDLSKKTLPLIAHLKLSNGLFHFVVIYKIKNNCIYIMDPAIGMKKISLDEFSSIFTGVIINTVPINAIPKYKKTRFIKNKIINEIKINKKIIMKIFIINVIILILSVLISLEVKIINHNYHYLMIFILIIIINELLTFKKSILLSKISFKLNLNLVEYFSTHIFKLPLNYLKLKKNGEIVTRYKELNDLSLNILPLIMDYLLNILLFIIFMFILLKCDIKIFVISLITLIIFYIYNTIIYKKVYKKIKYSLIMEENYNSNIIDFISNIETIKNMKSFNYYSNNVNNNLLEKNKTDFEIMKELYKNNTINNIFLNLLILIILYINISININYSNGMLIIIILNYLINIIKTFVYNKSLILQYISIINKNDNFLSIEFKKNLPTINSFNNIVLKNVTYRINENIIINSLNYKIKESDKIFIKGPSGIGKSTLLKILNKEYICDGNILIDDKIFNEIDTSNLISYTNQNETLFNDTLLNNITFGNKVDEILLNDIIEICKINDINIVKKVGLNAIIINNNLSGGEKNRIILARSLVNGKNIIILDEILKEVDYSLEMSIMKKVLNYFKDKTIIYVSHKNVEKLFAKTLIFKERNKYGFK